MAQQVQGVIVRSKELIDLYQQGRLPLDAFVTVEIDIDAFERMQGGNVLRSVVVR